ncbi:DUF6527 family protein, partial [Roseivivax isoporae]
NIVAFRCPGCATMHQVWTDRWRWNGDGDAPTFSPSIRSRGRAPQARCHSFVENGRIRFLPDCTHELAGKTVPLPSLVGGE